MERKYAYMLINESTRKVKTLIVNGEEASDNIRKEYNLPFGNGGYSKDGKFQFSCIVF